MAKTLHILTNPNFNTLSGSTSFAQLDQNFIEIYQDAETFNFLPDTTGNEGLFLSVDGTGNLVWSGSTIILDGGVLGDYFYRVSGGTGFVWGNGNDNTKDLLILEDGETRLIQYESFIIDPYYATYIDINFRGNIVFEGISYFEIIESSTTFNEITGSVRTNTSTEYKPINFTDLKDIAQGINVTGYDTITPLTIWTLRLLFDAVVNQDPHTLVVKYYKKTV